MERSYKIMFICLAMLLSISESKATEKLTKIYVYGFSSSFNDSTIFLTDLMELDSVWINTKTKFLYGRDIYSQQLKDYIQGKGVSTPTCVVSYADTRNEAEKKYIKLRDKYTNKKEGNYTIKYIGNKEFQFKAVSAVGDPNVTTNIGLKEEKAIKQKLKTQKKQKNLEDKSTKVSN